MEYEREVSHCSPSEYVQVVTIKTVRHAENSDNLDAVTFEEFGWNSIVGRDTHKPGDRVMFIPPDSMLPIDLSEKLNVRKYLSKGRVRIVRLRNNRSEGLVLPINALDNFEGDILKWEDLPSTTMSAAFTVARQDINPLFEGFYKIPNLLNEPFTFEPGESVVYSEKIHGTTFRFGILPHPKTGVPTEYVGSHYTVIDHAKCGDKNLYARIARPLLDKIKDIIQNVVFYAEIYGPGIQHLHYGLEAQDVRIFGATVDGEYINPSELTQLYARYGLKTVLFYKTQFKNIEQMRTLADKPSEYTTDHMREGIVIVSADRPRIMAKMIGFNYLTKKQKKRTERH